MKDINIAVDGPAGVGKSTTCKILAKKLGYKHINSGIFYRLIGFLLNEKGFLNNGFPNRNNNISVATTQEGSREGVAVFQLTRLDKKILAEIWDSSNILYNPNENSFLVGNKAIDLQTGEVSRLASIVARNEVVRFFVTRKMHELISKKRGFIVEGRDAASKIIPDAELKIFLDASIRQRTLRRMRQILHSKAMRLSRAEEGGSDSFSRIFKEIAERDRGDKTREIDPLLIQEDSIRIDASNLNQSEVLELLLLLKRSAGG